MMLLNEQLELPEGHVMTVWVIYFDAMDAPNEYVLRPQFVVRAATGSSIVVSPQAWVSKQIEVLRRMLPPGVDRLDPMPGDEPHIVETWI